jgi:hypothetical protein
VKVLKERTAEVQQGEQLLLPKVFVRRCTNSVRDFFLVCVGLEKQLTDLREAAQYLMDIYVPQEEAAVPKELVDRLDEAQGWMKNLLLDAS